MTEIQGCYKSITLASGLALTLFLNLLPASAKDRIAPDYLEFIGTCDASAAVPLDQRADRKKFVVAGDENSILNIYDWNAAAEGERIDLVELIPGLCQKEELDLEGAAKLGETTYWIGSHSRTKDGKLALERHIFFALEFRQEKNKTRAILKGSPCNTILKYLVEDPGYKSMNFEDFKSEEDKELAGESDRGFNIEALSASAGKSYFDTTFESRRSNREREACIRRDNYTRPRRLRHSRHGVHSCLASLCNSRGQRRRQSRRPAIFVVRTQ
ncbi:MAG TPA: hypothetical protein PKC98_14775 [Candidatus Melainabacteria bacterium]|nr:hypothetical protein [Candidatus Melainabacteria bacterium]